jgi:hypothetical protein
MGEDIDVFGAGIWFGRDTDGWLLVLVYHEISLTKL